MSDYIDVEKNRNRDDMSRYSTMPDIVYLGVLANCYKSILKVNIGNGFNIEKMEHKEGFKLLKILDRAFNDAEFKQRYITAGIMNEDYKPFYVIRKVENPKIPVRYSYGSINFPKFHECSFKLMNEGTHMLEIN